MATAVSVLCARMRMEEKWVIEALAAAGVPARQLPPCFAPLPIGPIPAQPFAVTTANGVAAELSGVIVDRCADRTVASITVPMLRRAGCAVIDAGIAARGSRLEIACTLAAAGVPRPETLLVTSEDAGIAAAQRLGWPVTLLPLNPGSAGIALLDRDIAEAALEHREVLGGSAATVGLMQAGAYREGAKIAAVVVDGGLVGWTGDRGGFAEERIADVAELTARALGAGILGVELAPAAGGLVVWDVRPVPEFRSLDAAGQRAVARAVAALAAGTAAGMNGQRATPAIAELFGAGAAAGAVHREVADVVALSA